MGDLHDQRRVVVELLRRVPELRFDRGVHVIEARRLADGEAIHDVGGVLGDESEPLLRRAQFTLDPALGRRVEERADDPRDGAVLVAHRLRGDGEPHRARLLARGHAHDDAAERLARAQCVCGRKVGGRDGLAVLVDEIERLREEASFVPARIAEHREVVARTLVGEQDPSLDVEHHDRDLECIEQLVGRDRGGLVRHLWLTTNSPKRVTAGAGNRARNRLPPSACTSTNTSPSRCSAATTSPRSYGTSNSTIGASDLNRAARVSKSTVTPSPVTADTSIARGCAARRNFTSSASATSTLLRTSCSGTWPAPMSRRTLCTASICCSASAELASTTWSRRSASTTSSSVDWNDSTSWCGRRCTKPTVSEASTVSPPGRRSWRVVGSRVENSRSSTRTSASVRRLRSVDLPALV